MLVFPKLVSADAAEQVSTLTLALVAIPSDFSGREEQIQSKNAPYCRRFFDFGTKKARSDQIFVFNLIQTGHFSMCRLH